MTGEITALRYQKKNKERVNVYLDGSFAFALPAIEAAKLRKGQHLTPAEVQALQDVDLRAKAYERAIRYLASRPRSEWEVRQRLRRYRSRNDSTLSEAHVDWVIEQLYRRTYLDDRAFARYWVEQRNRFKPMSPRALRYELRGKGIDADLAEAVIADQSNPRSAALKAAQSRAYRWYSLSEDEFRRKMIAFLQRRGFRWELIRDVVDQVWQERTEDF